MASTRPDAGGYTNMDSEMSDLGSVDEREKILNKKAVYEPSSSQRCRQLMCSQRWTVAILVTLGMFLLLTALIAAFARPGSLLCHDVAGGSHDAGGSGGDDSGSSSPKPGSGEKVQDYISTDGRAFPWKDLRLPRSVLPESYAIFMHPNISRSVFSGKVTITAWVVQASSFVVLHSKGLNISSVTVLRGEVNVSVEDRMEYRTNEQLYIRLGQTLSAQSRITIVVEFAGLLEQRLQGFYKSVYRTSSGEKRAIATTHFESSAARQAFPCFDEPDMKANFSMSMVREEGRTALFNMPRRDSHTLEGGLIQDDFETSVKMSTYLVAFVICDFEYISNRTKANTLVRVFAPAELISQAEYALSVAVKVLDYYVDFFGVPYPLPKQDMIAIPDFEAGAMENWGLITYRMTSILYDPKATSISDKQWVAITVAHELAHQWFGNIVTMKWWDDLWLNEGFASFVEILGVDKVEPSYHMMDQRYHTQTESALLPDSQVNSHPIQAKVTDPARISSIFDSISYKKGSSLIFMLRDFLGESEFQAGLTEYLKTYSYGNAETNDLWECLQKKSSLTGKGLTVQSVMETWTRQMGYPVVTVKQKPGTTDRLVISQKRFLLSESANASDSAYTSPYNYKWTVPFTYITETNPKKTLVWLTEKEMTLPGTFDPVHWIKGNVQSYGFYRVNYEPELWKLLIRQLKDNLTVFSVVDRVSILSDSFNLARAGLLDYSIVLDLLGYMKQEHQYMPLNTAFSEYGFIMQRLYLTDVYEEMQTYMRGLISDQVKEIGWAPQTDQFKIRLQSSLLSTAVRLKDKEAIEQARQRFDDPGSIPTHLKKLVYGTAVRYGDAALWHTVFENYTAAQSPSEIKTLLYALMDTEDARLIQLFLEKSLNTSIVRTQDFDKVIYGFSAHAGHIFTWRFFKRKWKTIHKTFATSAFVMGNIVGDVIAPFSTQYDFDEVTAFFKDKDVGSGQMKMKKSLERVQSHIDWSAKYGHVIVQWFQQHASD